MSASAPHPLVHFGRAPVDLRPIVGEAVDALGYFRDESVDELAAVLGRLWPSGTSPTMLLYNDLEPMSDAEKAAGGLGKGRMPRAIWALLSDLGKRDPRRAVQETTIRILLNLQRTQRERAAR